MIFSFIKVVIFLLQAFEAPEKAFKFMIRDIKYMTESTVCQMDEDYKQRQMRFGGNEERSREDPEAYSPSGRYPYKWFIVMETPVSYSRRYRGWAQNEEYLQAGIVFMQERMASAFLFLRAHHHLLRSGILWL